MMNFIIIILNQNKMKEKVEIIESMCLTVAALLFMYFMYKIIKSDL